MKIKVSLKQNTAHIRVHRSKSKSKLKDIQNQQKSTLKTELYPISAYYQTEHLSENNSPRMKQSCARPKKSCQHKKKIRFTQNSDHEYLKLSHRSREQLQRQNQKLRKENKVLNEYCVYFQKKLAKQQKKTYERAFSFRSQEFGRAKLLFGQLSKQTAGTCSKSNSKRGRHFQ